MSKNEEKKQNNSESFLHGTIFGVIAGTIIGLLIAPDKGEVTKEKIKIKAGELKTKSQEFEEKMHPTLEKTKNAVQEAAQIVEKNETLRNIKKKILKEKDKKD